MLGCGVPKTVLRYTEKQGMLSGDYELVRVCARQLIRVVYLPSGCLHCVSAALIGG